MVMRHDLLIKPEKCESAKMNPDCEYRNEKRKTPAEVSLAAKRTVFMKSIPWGSDEVTIQEFLKEAGEILEIRLAKNSEGKLRGFGHIEFASEEAAKKAYGMSGETLGGRPIFIDFAKEWKYPPPTNTTNNQKSVQGGKETGEGRRSKGNGARKWSTPKKLAKPGALGSKKGHKGAISCEANKADICNQRKTLVGTGTKIIFPEDDD